MNRASDDRKLGQLGFTVALMERSKCVKRRPGRQFVDRGEESLFFRWSIVE